MHYYNYFFKELNFMSNTEKCLTCKKKLLEFFPTVDGKYITYCLRNKCEYGEPIRKVIISHDTKDALQNMASGMVYDD